MFPPPPVFLYEIFHAIDLLCLAFPGHRSRILSSPISSPHVMPTALTRSPSSTQHLVVYV